MPPTQSHNRINSKNSNKENQDVRLLTKEGLKGIGGNSKFKKNSNPMFVVEEEQSRKDGLLIDALKNNSEKANVNMRLDNQSQRKAGDVNMVDSEIDHGIRGEDVKGRGAENNLEGRDKLEDIVIDGGMGKSVKNAVQGGGSGIGVGGQGFGSSINFKDVVRSALSKNGGKENEVKQGEGVSSQEAAINGSGIKIDELGSDKKEKKWSEMLKPKVGKYRMSFEYHSPEINDGQIIIKPPLSVDLQGRKAWANTLVGYFFENRVAFHTMEFNANRRWKNRGLLDVIMNDEGFFFFKFQSENDLLDILEEEVEHSNFFKVTAPEARPGQLRTGAHRRQKGRDDRCTPKGGPADPTQSPTTSFLTATT